MMKTIASLAAVAVLLGACANGDMGAKQGVGGVLGGVGGAVAGSQIGSGTGRIAATAAGTLLGALVGSQIGKSMDDVDRLRAQQAMRSAQTAPIGQPITWSNPRTGHSGQVTPVREGTDNRTGAYCREFQETVTIGGKQEQAYGTACRQPDGSWKVTN